MMVVVFFTATCAGFKGAPWVPTSGKDVKKALELVDIKKGQKVYDLGCGDGRFLFKAAKEGAVVEGFEISLLPYLYAITARLLQKEKENIKIFYRSFWKVDLHDVDVVYFFLIPTSYPRLKKKMEKEMKKGAKVIAYMWPIKGWKPIAESKGKRGESIFIYKM